MAMFDDFIQKNNLPKFRQKQLEEAFYQQAINSFDELTTWPKNLREQLKSEVEFIRLEAKNQVQSVSKTTKILFKRKDGKLIETVLMRHEDGRNTVCVSCMVGCPVNCRFCATGKLGYGGSLSADEIIDQILYFQRLLKAEEQKVTNVVFMGMGEPMLNLKEVMKSIQIMTDPGKLGMSSRRITISTSGYVPQLKQLIDSGFRGRIAISLHAPSQELREKLMPVVGKVYPLTKLFEVLDDYVKLTNKRISYEYILIDKVNDTKEHAEQLSQLLHNKLAHVNLIPFNPISEENFTRSSRNSIFKFQKILQQNGIHTTIRVTMGDEVAAACGQLAAKESK